MRVLLMEFKRDFSSKESKLNNADQDQYSDFKVLIAILKVIICDCKLSCAYKEIQ